LPTLLQVVGSIDYSTSPQVDTSVLIVILWDIQPKAFIKIDAGVLEIGNAGCELGVTKGYISFIVIPYLNFYGC